MWGSIHDGAARRRMRARSAGSSDGLSAGGGIDPNNSSEPPAADHSRKSFSWLAPFSVSTRSGPRVSRARRRVSLGLRRRQPRRVAAKQVPHGAVMLALVGLEIEMQHDDGPTVSSSRRQLAFHQRANTIEEMLLEGRLGALQRCLMRDHGAKVRFVPRRIRDVLLDHDGEAGRQGAIDAIAPASALGIGVVRMEQRADCSAGAAPATAGRRARPRRKSAASATMRTVATNTRISTTVE